MDIEAKVPWLVAWVLLTSLVCAYWLIFVLERHRRKVSLLTEATEGKDPPQEVRLFSQFKTYISSEGWTVSLDPRKRRAEACLENGVLVCGRFSYTTRAVTLEPGGLLYWDISRSVLSGDCGVFHLLGGDTILSVATFGSRGPVISLNESSHTAIVFAEGTDCGTGCIGSVSATYWTFDTDGTSFAVSMSSDGVLMTRASSNKVTRAAKMSVSRAHALGLVNPSRAREIYLSYNDNNNVRTKNKQN